MPKLTREQLGAMLMSGTDDGVSLLALLLLVVNDPGNSAAYYLDVAIAIVRDEGVPAHILEYERVVNLVRYEWLVEVGVLSRDERGYLRIAPEFKEIIR